MVRVANSNQKIASRLLSYIHKDMKSIDLALYEQENPESKLDASYVAGRNAVAIAAGNEIIKKMRWYMETELSQVAVTPHDDADIDAIDINIRTREVGL